MDSATDTNYAPAWVSGPRHRGTWSILYSCVFTLSICVWSVIHLNIPPKREPNSYQYWRKTKWVFVAIFAPEAVLYSAWQQFYLARRFIREMQNLCRDHHKIPRVDPRSMWEKYIECFLGYINRKVKGLPETILVEKAPSRSERAPSPSEKKGNEKSDSSSNVSDEMKDEIASFSMTYGFYVTMGGFVVNTSDIYDHEKAHWLTVTPRGVIEFAQTLPWEQFRAHFSIDEGSIKDKSKADCLTKILRLDIRDPNPVNTASFKDKLALMLVRSPGTAYWPYVDFKLPSRWTSCFSEEGWPDEKNSGEATFLHFDTRKSEAEPGGSDPTSETYSVIPHPPEMPSEDSSNHEDSDKVSVTEASVHTDRAVSGALSVRSDSSGDQGNPSTVGKSSVAKISSNYSVERCRDRTVEQADFEGTLGINFQPARPIPISFKEPDIYRKPPTKRGRQRDVSWSEGVSNTVRHSHERVSTVVTLSTGEFLQSGIGPAGFFTSKEPSAAQITYERYSAWASRSRIPLIQDAVDSQYRPPQTRLVEVDERLKPFIDIPPPQWNYHPKTLRRTRPSLEGTYIHQVSAALSEKDITRWTRAANAFRAELAEKTLRARSKQPADDRDEPGGSKEIPNDIQLVGEANHASPDTLSLRAEDYKVDRERKLVTLWKAQKHSPAAVDLGEFCYRSHNIDYFVFGHVDGTFILAMYVTMSYISSIYAGIHLALWNHDFPTKAEAILWKISSITLGIPAPLFVIACSLVSILLSRWPYLAMKRVFRHSGFCTFWISVVTKKWSVFSKGINRDLIALWNGVETFGGWLGKHVFKLLNWLHKLYEASKLHRGLFYWACQHGGIVLDRFLSGIRYSLLGILMVVVFGPLIAAGVLYCFSRVYIVAESFLSLRHVPVGVYEQVSWAQYIPHL